MNKDELAARLKAVTGTIFLVCSLVLLRFFQLSNADLGWIIIMAGGVFLFTIGTKWILENVRFLRSYRELWPFFAACMTLAWIIHSAQLEEMVANSRLGEAFGAVAAQTATLLLRLSGVDANLHGQLLSMAPPSKVPAVLVTPLCGGLLSFLMFTFAFGVVLLDVGKRIPRHSLAGLFLLGALVTFFISSVRLYLVLVLGFHWGLDVMMLAHNYLGYVLFLTFIAIFWYFTLSMSNRSAQGPRPAPESFQIGTRQWYGSQVAHTVAEVYNRVHNGQ